MGRILLGGIFPGIIMAVAMIGYVTIRCKLHPEQAPLSKETYTFKEKVVALKDAWTILALFIIVIGSIYAGIASATEAGAVGCLGALLIAFFKKRLTWKAFKSAMLDTIKMSIMGSVIGCLLALPYAVAASANINRNKVSLSVLRFILNIIRTLPTLVIASLCALVFGLGTFAGTVAIVIFTFGVVTKMLYESIETINMGPFEALESAGADKFRAFWSAVFPQVLPTYLSHCLYSFEMNVRAASILGYVGAGGLGILIDERIGWRDYNGLGTVLLTLFVAVLIIENLSQFLRSKLS